MYVLQWRTVYAISRLWRYCGPSNYRFNFILYWYAPWVFFLGRQCAFVFPIYVRKYRKLTIDRCLVVYTLDWFPFPAALLAARAVSVVPVHVHTISPARCRFQHSGLENSPQSFGVYTVSQSRSVVTSAENPAPDNSPQSIGELRNGNVANLQELYYTRLVRKMA